MTTLSGRDEPPPWRGRWLLYAVGVVFIVVGLRGIFTHTGNTAPTNWALFFGGSILGHDLLLAPIVFGLAVLGLRRVPARFRGVLQAGVVVSGVVTLVALPVVIGFGRRSDTPSQLPLPYARNLLIVLALIWIGVLGLLVLRRRQRSREVIE